ncbi:immunoglobulin domain-containing family protein [Citrifermentans bemidjiense]|nr:hypothetical protein [Citrifermentans bemidjiense]
MAYIDLPPSAAKALPYFYGKYGRKFKVVLYGKRGDHNIAGDFEFSYEEAVRLGFAKRTFARVIDELIEKGFIEMAGYGGLRGFCKSYNKFRPSYRWQRYGQPDFEAVPRYPSELA